MVISITGKLRQEEFKFETSLGHIVRLCLKRIDAIEVCDRDKDISVLTGHILPRGLSPVW